MAQCECFFLSDMRNDTIGRIHDVHSAPLELQRHDLRATARLCLDVEVQNTMTLATRLLKQNRSWTRHVVLVHTLDVQAHVVAWTSLVNSLVVHFRPCPCTSILALFGCLGQAVIILANL